MIQLKKNNIHKCSKCGKKVTGLRTTVRKLADKHPDHKTYTFVIKGIKVCTNHKKPRIIVLDPDLDITCKL